MYYRVVGNSEDTIYAKRINARRKKTKMAEGPGEAPRGFEDVLCNLWPPKHLRILKTTIPKPDGPKMTMLWMQCALLAVSAAERELILRPLAKSEWSILGTLFEEVVPRSLGMNFIEFVLSLWHCTLHGPVHIRLGVPNFARPDCMDEDWRRAIFMMKMVPRMSVRIELNMRGVPFTECLLVLCRSHHTSSLAE